VTPVTDRARTFWNDQAPTYGDSWLTKAKAAMSERELTLITRLAPETRCERTLDVGIGTGRILYHHLEATPVKRLYGLDAAQEMVRTCRERFRGQDRLAGLAVADLSSPLPFSGTFDVITSIRVLKYARDWRDAIGRFAGHLSPGGVLIFSMPNIRSLNRLSRAYGVEWHSTTNDELRRVVVGSGLEFLESHGATRLPYGLYERSDNPIISTVLQGTDAVLDRALGKIAGVREIFVAARRPLTGQ
jgi:SAM-dependent methyltransferase